MKQTFLEREVAVRFHEAAEVLGPKRFLVPRFDNEFGRNSRLGANDERVGQAANRSG